MRVSVFVCVPVIGLYCREFYRVRNPYTLDTVYSGAIELEHNRGRWYSIQHASLYALKPFIFNYLSREKQPLTAAVLSSVCVLFLQFTYTRPIYPIYLHSVNIQPVSQFQLLLSNAH